MLTPDPRARSAVICTLVQEICRAVEWVQGREAALGRTTDEELVSIRRLARAAHDHRLRMAFGPGATGASP